MERIRIHSCTGEIIDRERTPEEQQAIDAARSASQVLTPRDFAKELDDLRRRLQALEGRT